MRLHSISYSADQAINKFNKSKINEMDVANTLFYQKLDLCDFQVLLVTIDGPDKEGLTNSSYDFQILDTLFNTWRSITKNPTIISRQKKAWRIINRIGETLQPRGKNKSSPIIRRFVADSRYNQYFVLLNGSEPQGVPVAELYPLCNIWQLANGNLPLHAAGVIHKDKLFLFMGPSGAGKSTVTELSREIGNTTLDEDQLLIFRPSANEFRANAWGYNLDSCDLPIRAVFNLVQDAEDRIVPMMPMTLARLLFERHNDVVANQSPAELTKKAFAFFAEVSRQIPGFELHFRKTPDFWKLIDEQFPQ